jgi:hypothetical protein
MSTLNCTPPKSPAGGLRNGPNGLFESGSPPAGDLGGESGFLQLPHLYKILCLYCNIMGC